MYACTYVGMYVCMYLHIKLMHESIHVNGYSPTNVAHAMGALMAAVKRIVRARGTTHTEGSVSSESHQCMVRPSHNWCRMKHKRHKVLKPNP